MPSPNPPMPTNMRIHVLLLLLLPGVASGVTELVRVRLSGVPSVVVALTVTGRPHSEATTVTR